MKNHLFFFYLLVALIAACKETPIKTNEIVAEIETELESKSFSLDDLIRNLEDSQNDEVIVIAHRGDWRNAPENSLQAIQNCIHMGVDMVEIDVRETKDGVLVLMHDETIDRTTTGTGKVEDLTWEYLQTLNLKDGIGHSTPHKIPTLKEALLLCKDNILVNLDKSYKIFDKCLEEMQQTGTVNQVIVKGAVPYNQVKEEFGQYLDKVYFMPIVRLKNENASQIVGEYLENYVPVAFEFTVPQDTISFINEFKNIREKGASVWVNSLWPQHNGGHNDEKAAIDPTVYDWFIENQIDMIQTDRPEILLTYLRENNLHN